MNIILIFVTKFLLTPLELVDEVKNGTELNFDDFSLYVSVVKE